VNAARRPSTTGLASTLASFLDRVGERSGLVTALHAEETTRLPLLRERDVRRVTFVTPAPADGAAARVFAAAGWREARRTPVQAWLEVLFVEYRRDDGAASAATL